MAGSWEEGEGSEVEREHGGWFVQSDGFTGVKSGGREESEGEEEVLDDGEGGV